MAMTTIEAAETPAWSDADWPRSQPRFDLTVQPAVSQAIGLSIDAYHGVRALGRTNPTQPAAVFAGAAEARGGFAKRAFDVLISAAALLALAPLMAIIALLIKLGDGGKVIYLQRRVGHAGRIFPMLKFRSMLPNAAELLEKHLAENPEARAEWESMHKLRRDPRVTAVGRLLRKSSLDELPQLINVLRGDMSIVGPRPVWPEALERHGDYVDDYLSTRPGLTGLWQISGRSSRSYKERISLDRFYVRRWSLKLDLALMLMTVPAVMKFEDTA